MGASISIHWVPGHAGIAGNEIADQCAGDAAARECHAGDDWWPPGPIRGHRGGCQRVMTGGHRVLLEDTRGLPGCRASAAGWRNLSTQSGGPQSEQCDRPVSAGEKQMARTMDRMLFIEFHSG